MFTLSRARRQGGKAGEPLPTVYTKLEKAGAHFRRSQLTLISAAPGVGKSLFTLNLALKAGVPGFYFSADTDAFTTFCRAAANQTGWLISDVENYIAAGHLEAIETRLDNMESLRFDFTASPGLDDIEDELKAFAMTYGEWPALVVIDNISNLWMPDSGGEMEQLGAACDYLHQLARKIGACVIALHHVTGDYDDGTKPVPQSGLRGKISKVPAMILTLHVSKTLGTLNVSVVKNRTGPNDPSGSTIHMLRYEPERMVVEG